MPPSLVSGQIAINEADGKLFYRNGSGAVTQLATGGGGGGTELFPYANAASFPATGATTALYLSISSGRVYQWNGSVYSEVGPVGGGGSLSATVTIPASGDLNRPDTLLLARFDGNTDDSGPAGLTATIGGSATTSSTTTKFGGGAAYFASGSDSTSNVIKYGSGSAWNLMGADFTIEGWIYATAVNNYSGLITRDNQTDRRNWSLFIDFDGVKPLSFVVFNTSASHYVALADSQAFPTNQWVHVAVVRDSGTFRMYRGGVQVASAAASGGSGTLSTASGPLSVGAINENGNYGFTGYIDEVRVLSRCIYTGGTTFTPPIAAVPSTYTAAQTLSVVGTGSIGPSEDAALRALFIPAAPTSLTATGGNAQAVLSWTAPSVSAQTPITDYREQFSSNNGATWSTFSAAAASTATSATITGLTNGTAYVFRVAAVNALGTGAYTAASSAVTPAAAPAGVTVLSGSASGSGTNTITATATGNISVSVPSTRTLTWTGSPGQYLVGPQQAGFSYDSELPGWYRNFIGSSFSVIAGTYTTENTGNGATLTFTP